VQVEPDVTANVEAALTPGAVASGFVRTADGSAVAAANVSCGRGNSFSESSFAVTGADGAFRLEGLPLGQVVLFAEAGERGKAQVVTRTEAGTETRVDLVLQRGLDLVGRVVDESGQPIARTEILAQIDPDAGGARHGFSGYAVADERGAFRIANCPDDVLQLALKWPGQSLMPALLVGGVRAAAGEAIVRLDRSRMPSARIVGVARDAGGAPIASAEVVIERRDGPWGTVTLSSPDGSFQSPLLAPDEYQVEIRHGSVAPFASAPITLAPNEVRDLGELHLGAGGSLAVTLSSDEPQLLERAWFFFAREDGVEAAITRKADRLIADRLAAGRYRLSVGGPGIAAKSMELEVRDGGEAAAALVLESARPVALRITEASRSRRRSVALEVADASGAACFRGSIPRDAGGRFGVELGLPAGRYTAMATCEDGRKGELAFVIGDDCSDPIELELPLR